MLGLGAGWFENEHGPFGIPLPPIGERIDRLISAVEVLHLLFSPQASTPEGVTRDDPFYPLAGATNLPAPLTPGGPPIILGGQKPRGIRLAARLGAGWILTGTEAGDVALLRGPPRRASRRARGRGRDPDAFELIAQVHTGPEAADRSRALDAGPGDGGRRRRPRSSSACRRRSGPRALEDAHRDVLLPLHAEHG